MTDWLQILDALDAVAAEHQHAQGRHRLQPANASHVKDVEKNQNKS